MFDLSWTELLIVAVVAIIVVGPKDLPRALRGVGRWTGKARRMARDFRRQFDEALREAELDTIKKDVESIGKIDPVADLRKETREIEAGLKVDEKEPSAPSATTPAPTTAAKDSEMDELAADTGTDEPAPHPPQTTTPADAKP
jgi:sec-independent protein translocase protein TatB